MIRLLEAAESRPAGKDLGGGYIEATIPRHLVRADGGLGVYEPSPYVFRTEDPGIFERAHYPGGRMRAPGIVDPTMRIVLGLLP